MYQLRLLGILLRPSLFSALVTTALAIAMLAISNWSSVTHSPLLYDYFLGQYGVTTALQRADTILDPRIFDQVYTYYIAVGLVAILVGILVYITLQSITHGLSGAKETIEEIEESEGSSRRSVEVEVALRWIIRIVGLTLWAIYLIFFVNVVMPFCILTTRQGAMSLGDNWYTLFFGLLGFIVLWLGLHQHVIFARLTALRPRLFGGHDIITAELYER